MCVLPEWRRRRRGPIFFPGSADQLADPDTLDRVYGALIDALPTRGAEGLLRGRGLPSDVVDALIEEGHEQHFRRVPRFVILQRDGREYWTLAGKGGILIPVRDGAGRVVALKVRLEKPTASGKRRVLTSAGHNGPSPGSPLHFSRPTDDVSTVRVTGGETKADVAALLTGVCTISLPGVSHWRRAREAVESVRARRVLVSLDADFRVNPHVGDALCRMVADLKDAGLDVALQVWVVEAAGRASTTCCSRATNRPSSRAPTSTPCSRRPCSVARPPTRTAPPRLRGRRRQRRRSTPSRHAGTIAASGTCGDSS